MRRPAGRLHPGFAPQVVAAITASLGGAGLAGRLGWKSVYLGGLAANLASMALLGQERLVTISASVASGVIAFYQLGYGAAAFGVGSLRTAGFTLPGIYGASAVVAGLLGLLSLAVARGGPPPTSLHPRPTSHLK